MSDAAPLSFPDPQPSLGSARLELTPYVPEDARWLTELIDSPEVVRWTGLPFPFDDATAAAWIARTQEGYRTGARTGWGARLRGSGVPVGGGSVRLNPRSPIATIGFWLGRAHWGQGLGRELAEALTAWSFDVLGARRVEADCVAENVASARILEDCGFEREGRQREAFERDGAIHDLLLFGALRRDRS